VPLHFLVDDALTALPGDTVTLTGAEAHHAAVVRRVRTGETVTVGDGRGAWLTATVTSATPKAVDLHVESRRDTARPARRVVLVQALAKGDRDELAIQAATELGADEIVPWQASRSVSRWDAAKAAKGVARWTSIVREASKQAHRDWVPGVADPVSTAQLARRSGTLLVLEPTAAEALSEVELDDTGDIILIVGPEGGISPDELTALTAAGARSVRLGSTVLRTSTAGPAALAVVSTRLGRW
jgi:16S rRNA (uracil1498-N3)-methyltransferase